MKITLKGKDSKNKNIYLVVPVNPEKLIYKTSGKFQEYDIIDLGTAKIPSGRSLENVSWESFFPGKILRKEPYVRNYKPPESYHNMINYWRKTGSKINLRITGTPINFDVYIENYEATWEGANGNIYYSVEFSGAIDVTVETVKKKKGKTSGSSRQSKNSGAKKYTVKKGDCLWNISKKFYKKGSEWKKIYNANKSVIEKAAKKHGLKSSNKGWWIFPGTVLKIP